MLKKFVVLLFLLAFSISGCSKPLTFWHIEQRATVWWLVSPDNTPQFLTGVTTVQPFLPAKRGPSYHSADFSGNIDDWATKTASRIHEFGFTHAGAWSNAALRPYTPYTLDLNILASCKLPISDQGWTAEAEGLVKYKVSPLANDQHLIGYFTDNELDWNMLAPYASKYFTTIEQAIHLYDSHHLILGVRFNRLPPDSVLEASRGHVDVHSFNLYSNAPQSSITLLEAAYAKTGIPTFLSEFSFYSSDNSSGNMNTSGFGGEVINQQARADAYRKVIANMAGTSYCVGTEWFQFSDEPPQGRPDGEDCNFGVVSIHDDPYLLLVTAVQESGNVATAIHKNSISHTMSLH